MSLAFLKNYRKSLKPFSKISDTVNVVNDLKLAAKNTEIPSIHNMFDKVEFTLKDNQLAANGVKLNSVEFLLRRGELQQLFDILNLKIKVRAVDQIGFIKSLGDNIPDLKIKKLDDKINIAKQSNSDIDINAATGKELKEKLTKKSRSKLDRIGNLIKRVAGASPVVAGLFATMKIGGDFYDNLVDSTNKNKGCFLIRSVNGVANSCKLYNRSCEHKTKDTSNACDDRHMPIELSFNVALFLMNALNNENKSNEIGKLLNLNGPLTTLNIQSVLDNYEKYDQVISNYLKEFKNIPNPCMQMNEIEFGIVPACRSCNPSADINSTEYVDTSMIATNITIQCIQRGSIIHTLVDIASGMGIEIFNAVGSIFPNGKKIAIVIFLFIILFICISIILKS